MNIKISEKLQKDIIPKLEVSVNITKVKIAILHNNKLLHYFAIANEMLHQSVNYVTYFAKIYSQNAVGDINKV